MFAKACLVVLGAAILKQVVGDAPMIVGYTPSSDLTSYAAIDLDIQALSAGLANASYWYSIGGNSIKSDNSIRTIKGFSTKTSNLAGFKW
jgi:hypothetical protein